MAATTTKTCKHLTAGTRRNGERYVGVLRAAGKIVAECGHTHTNRDTSSGTNGASARNCAESLLLAAKLPEARREFTANIRNSWQALTQGFFRAPQSTIDEARVKAAEKADAYEAKVAETVELLAEHGQCFNRYVCTPVRSEYVPEVDTTQDIPSWMRQ